MKNVFMRSVFVACHLFLCAFCTLLNAEETESLRQAPALYGSVSACIDGALLRTGHPSLSIQDLSEQSLGLEPEMIAKYQTMEGLPHAHFGYIRADFGRAKMITYDLQRNGSVIHVAWYNDGHIVTVLTGREQGKQVMFLKDGTVYLPCHGEEGDGCLIHEYSWGVIYSCINKQVIEFD